MFIRYLWIVKGSKGIEMGGVFTNTRWQQFCKQPHPFRKDITIQRIKES